jgi:hypothetical protein
MKLFDNEELMQQWLSRKFAEGKSLSELIVNYEDYGQAYPKKQSFSIQKVVESFRFCLQSFENNEVIVENKNISLTNKDILKPDFLVYAPETQSIIIIELKNIPGPTREVGTEVGAYAAEIKTHLPFLADGDIINVVISCEWPTLLRHYVYNDIVWLQRKAICLEPVNTAEGTLLKIIAPSLIADFSPEIEISGQQLGGYHLCLYDERIYNGGDYNRMDENRNQMLCALAAMAAKGNSLKTHGFAFLWRHCFDIGFAPYNITMVNLSAFQSLPKLFLDPEFRPNDITKRFLKILMDHAPEGHGHMLDSVCDSGIHFLESFSQPRPENYTDWNTLKPKVFENSDAIAFVGWGIFEELFFERLAQEYRNSDFDPRHDCPRVAIEMLNEIVSEQSLHIDWQQLGYDKES